MYTVFDPKIEHMNGVHESRINYEYEIYYHPMTSFRIKVDSN